MKHPDPVNFGIVLPTVAEMMDDQKLSKEEAMAALRWFLEGDVQPRAVKEAIARLEAAEDEAEFRTMLGKESVRALIQAPWSTKRL